MVLFPSLAGSVLECEESPIPGYKDSRIWMGLGTLMAKSNSSQALLQCTAAVILQHFRGSGAAAHTASHTAAVSAALHHRKLH